MFCTTPGLRICFDYRELNKQTTKDAYPLPLPDEVHFLYIGPSEWILAITSKTRRPVFCPGPGMGLYQFWQMPFGLTGTPFWKMAIVDELLQGRDGNVRAVMDLQHCCVVVFSI